MKKKLFTSISSFIIILLSLSVYFSSATPSLAQAGSWNCSVSSDPSTITTEHIYINKLTINTSLSAAPNKRYYVYIYYEGKNKNPSRIDAETEVNPTTREIEISEPFDRDGKKQGDSSNTKFDERKISFFVVDKDMGELVLKDQLIERGYCQVNQSMELTVKKTDKTGGDNCTLDFKSKSSLKPGEDVVLTVIFPDTDLGREFRGVEDQKFDVEIFWPQGERKFNGDRQISGIDLAKGFSIGNDYSGNVTHKVIVSRTGFSNFGVDRRDCRAQFTPLISGGYESCREDPDCEKGQICTTDDKGQLICRLPESGEGYNPCAQGDNKNSPFKCQTAIGEISTSPGGFLKSVLVLVLSLSGGIIILLIIVNGYKLIISQGDPEKVKEARESITSAIAGLLLIIFSIAILQFITVEVLNLPGFK